MAATAWSVFDSFQEQLGVTTMNLSTDNFDIHLFNSASNASAASALSTLGSITNEIASGTVGYSRSGKAFANNVWSTGASTGVRRFDGDDTIWTATTGNISAIKFAVIVRRIDTGRNGSNQLIAKCRLSTSAFDLNSGSTLTIQMAAGGIFEMTSAD